jgi:SNF2 family DNA or RNA helicase
VILHDLDFNPHNDCQAEDRAWRLGQTRYADVAFLHCIQRSHNHNLFWVSIRPVQVIKLICPDTIEEMIHKRQESKLALDQKLSNDEPQDGKLQFRPPSYPYSFH